MRTLSQACLSLVLSIPRLHLGPATLDPFPEVLDGMSPFGISDYPYEKAGEDVCPEGDGKHCPDERVLLVRIGPVEQA